MVPSALVILEAFPLSVSGKLDRKLLPRPEYTSAEEQYDPPKGRTEARLERVWAELLGREKVSRMTSFFDLGGHSLLAVKLASKIKAEFGGIPVTVQTLFTHDTIAELGERVDGMLKARGDAEEGPAVVQTPSIEIAVLSARLPRPTHAYIQFLPPEAPEQTAELFMEERPLATRYEVVPRPGGPAERPEGDLLPDDRCVVQVTLPCKAGSGVDAEWARNHLEDAQRLLEAFGVPGENVALTPELSAFCGRGANCRRQVAHAVARSVDVVTESRGATALCLYSVSLDELQVVRMLSSPPARLYVAAPREPVTEATLRALGFAGQVVVCERLSAVNERVVVVTPYLPGREEAAEAAVAELDKAGLPSGSSWVSFASTGSNSLSRVPAVLLASATPPLDSYEYLPHVPGIPQFATTVPGTHAIALAMLDAPTEAPPAAASSSRAVAVAGAIGGGVRATAGAVGGALSWAAGYWRGGNQ
eukprot:Hpha_TRINITY_DN16516_c1_g3::TRINITY_DN16516_c1_g3_i13::g.136856::m.136856